MPREARRSSPPPTGSSFVRALAALDDTPAPALRDDAFAERLSQWFDWTRAIALSAALGEGPSGARATGNTADARELARVRSALQARLDETCRDLAPDFVALRQQVLAWQMAAQAQIGPLRRRLRATLAAGPLSRLAQMDAVLEQVMAPRESSLLAAAVQRLEPRHRTQPESFARDLHVLLLAELELRLQPVEGLIDAGRAPTSE
jgi:hypothetical protein